MGLADLDLTQPSQWTATGTIRTVLFPRAGESGPGEETIVSVTPVVTLSRVDCSVTVDIGNLFSGTTYVDDTFAYSDRRIANTHSKWFLCRRASDGALYFRLDSDGYQPVDRPFTEETQLVLTRP